MSKDYIMEHLQLAYDQAMYERDQAVAAINFDKAAAFREAALLIKEAIKALPLPEIWTDGHCKELNALQHDNKRHPFTCGKDSTHRPLIATRQGWQCADCDYHSCNDIEPPLAERQNDGNADTDY